MSTEYAVHHDGEKEVSIVERSAKFDLELFDYSGDTSGPQQMKPDEALQMAAGIIYAVWCSYPDEANALIELMNNDQIPTVWNKMKLGLR